jgi:hypothetical protein
MKLYRLHVKQGVEAPEDWGRVLIPFAGASGLRLHEEFKRDAIIECGPLLIKEIMSQLGEYLEYFDYDPSERDMMVRRFQRDEDDDGATFCYQNY